MSTAKALWRDPTGRFAVVVVVAVVLVAAVSLVWLPYPLLQADSSQRWSGSSLAHPLGTDQIGRDNLSWLMAGARTAVVVAVGSTLVAGLIGLPLGAAVALARTRLSEVLIVLVDVLIAFPTLMVAMALAASLGASLATVVVAVGSAQAVRIARVVRPEIVRVAGSDFVLAAKAAGTRPLARFGRHVLPNTAPVMLVQLSMTAAVAILAEAGLTFLGYGAASGTPSWGRSLAQSQGLIGVEPLAVLWPGLTIAVVVLALNLLGDVLRQVGDPRLGSPRQPASNGPTVPDPRGPRERSGRRAERAGGFVGWGAVGLGPVVGSVTRGPGRSRRLELEPVGR
ncbi:MAG: ABC transporter permease [Bifidobacteriaceae bacterium]|jgi:peptide/nickel transport system permease protein|nr:ABC transporter permease [Bifidobacteriaceae bacterium]